MKKPNFFILGAPKCGTSALASWLSDHPAAFLTADKEPHHFNTDMAHRNYPNLARYERLFQGAGPQHVAVGEASVWYLYSRDAVRNIETYAEKPRYIVCLRNPVDMAYSLHEQQVFSGNEDVTDFQAAWRLADQRRQRHAVPRHALDATTLIYPDVCALGTQVHRLLQAVESGRVHFVLMDDIKMDARRTFDAVQRFVGLEPAPDIALPVVNAAKQRRSVALQKLMRGLGRVKAATGMKHSLGMLKKMDAINRKARARAPMDPVFREMLTHYFAPEVVLLEKELGLNLSAWRGR